MCGRDPPVATVTPFGHRTTRTTRATTCTHRFKELIELLPPHGEEVVFETGGHNCQATQAEVLAERLVSFCASTCRQGRS